MLFTWYLLTMFIPIISTRQTEDYCGICSNHTMCIFTEPVCDIKDRGVTDKEQEIILKEHNKYRSLVANGTKAPQPSAANMFQLQWDPDLAEVAQRWAEQCTFGHDDCRNDDRFYVGQNVYMTVGVNEINWKDCVGAWFNEVGLWNPAFVENFQFDNNTGHYTQIVWATTMFVGCGRAEYDNNQLYVCNYGPAGNVIGTSVYRQGEPCSRCEAPSSCANFLCSVKDCGVLQQ